MEDKKQECKNEIDRISIEQLHESTLQISNQCFEYKKLCVTVIGVIVTALLKFSESSSLTEIAFICLVIVLGFWCCDSIAYYYQKSNRILMGKLTIGIKERHGIEVSTAPAQGLSWFKAIFNPSMALYMYIAVMCLLAVIYGLLEPIKVLFEQ
ncbi:hypothetical protein [Vibrio ezurae]|uniref:hypothetical protein n=1 Tax=Vibrio ezurae TaxID=252583 RepID=UPI0012EB1942|nr:hypothetical protein [Vibrio ezurae]